MIRITYSSRDSSARRSGSESLFVKNLDKSVDNKTLNETFSGCVSIVSCKVATDQMGQSKAYGFVQIESEDPAKNAIEKLNDYTFKINCDNFNLFLHNFQSLMHFLFVFSLSNFQSLMYLKVVSFFVLNRCYVTYVLYSRVDTEGKADGIIKLYTPIYYFDVRA